MLRQANSAIAYPVIWDIRALEQGPEITQVFCRPVSSLWGRWS